MLQKQNNVEVRPAQHTDLDALCKMNHQVICQYGYQLDFQQENGFHLAIERIRLPRQVTLTAPRGQQAALYAWEKAYSIYVGLIDDAIVTYMSIDRNKETNTLRVHDLVVIPEFRRYGVATNMLIVCENLALSQNYARIMLEFSLRNDAAFCLAKRAGFKFCGFVEKYLGNGDSAVFFDKRLV